MALSVDNIRVFSRVFSRPVFEALAKGREPSNVLDFLPFSDMKQDGRPLHTFFSEGYKELCRNYRNEYVYKTEVANRIVFGRHSPRTSSLLSELHVGKSIVDIAIFNGTSTAYEIKTEYDTPRRLQTQTPDYLKAFDKVYVVTHPNLSEKYAEIVPDKVGVIALNNRGSLKVVKYAESNLVNIEILYLFRMLKRSEYLPAIEKFIGEKINLPNGLIYEFCEDIFKKIPQEIAHKIYLNAMRSRTTSDDIVNFVNCLPSCLRVLGMSSVLSNVQRKKILSILGIV
ncbi:sce7726 family protein [Photorhabdus laumondii]|uniref:sce7726 family protein n=1 Tax=Photorhabdus laumondii TaxID=2218628 RepID=UPI0025AF01FD|nr:sce7726 family protein [Photorhabdus laumondii]